MTITKFSSSDFSLFEVIYCIMILCKYLKNQAGAIDYYVVSIWIVVSCIADCEIIHTFDSKMIKIVERREK